VYRKNSGRSNPSQDQMQSMISAGPALPTREFRLATTTSSVGHHRGPSGFGNTVVGHFELSSYCSMMGNPFQDS
jgi:hypothetical protein